MGVFYQPESPLMLVALCAPRNGYIKLAANSPQQTQPAHVPSVLFTAAQAWADQLVQLGAIKVYWLCLSEAEPHLHWHLCPRWPQDTTKGLALLQPAIEAKEAKPLTWQPDVTAALQTWAVQHGVYLVP
jgi:hypothetical protein